MRSPLRIPHAAFLLALLLGTLAPAAARAAPHEEEALKTGDLAPTFAMKTINPELSKLKLFSLGRHVGEHPAEPRSATVQWVHAGFTVGALAELTAKLKI